MPAQKLTPAQVEALLPEVPGWTYAPDNLSQTFKFKNFVAVSDGLFYTPSYT